jgi:hypothetical protein
MAATFVFPAAVDANGKIAIENPPRWRIALQKLAGKRIEVVIRQPKSKRSLDQNKWWWGIAIPLLADELGYDKHEHDGLHYALVSKCFGVTQDTRTGVEVPNKRSSQLTVAEFAELMEWVTRFAAQEWGVVLPLPGEAE